jgi:hypothetical protein
MFPAEDSSVENPLAPVNVQEESGYPTSDLISPATTVSPSVAAKFAAIEQQLSALSADAKVDEGDGVITSRRLEPFSFISRGHGTRTHDLSLYYRSARVCAMTHFLSRPSTQR